MSFKTDAEYIEKLEWLKKWGSFNHDEVHGYPWSLVDVMSIMEDWRIYKEKKPRRAKKRKDKE